MSVNIQISSQFLK